MDYRQMKNDAYGIGQRRGMGNSGGGGGGGMYSSNFGGSYNNNFSGGGGNNNNYPRSGDDRSGFNPNNQRFGGNSGDDFQDNYRGHQQQQLSNYGSSNMNRGQSNLGNLARLLELESSQNFGNRNAGASGNFNSELRHPENSYRGPQSQNNSDRFFNDVPRNQNQGSFGNFGHNEGPSFGGNNGPSFGPNDGPNFGGNNGPSYGGNNGPSYGGNDGPSYGGNNPRNSGNFNNDNFPGRGPSFDNQPSGFNDSYGRGGNQGNFGQNSGNFGNNSGNFGDNNRDMGNYNNRGPGGGGLGPGGPGYSGNNSGGGFSNNISRTFNDSRNNWNNSQAQSQSSSFQNSGYQSNSGGGGGGAIGGGGGASSSGWEASQRAFNTKRNQLQKMNLNNGGVVRKPGPPPAAKAVQILRNNPRAAAAIVTATGRNNVLNNRNSQPNKPANIRPGNAVGGQKKPPNAPPTQYKVNNLAPKPKPVAVVNKKPPVAGQAARSGSAVVRSGPQAAKTGPPAVRTGPQVQKKGPLVQRTGPQTTRTGPHLVKAGPQAGIPAGVAKRPNNAPGLPVQVGQKRIAPAPPVETEPASKSVKKWRRVARKRGFLMGGFKIPYLNDQPKKIPQPEADSYALSFFEQNFNYSTNQDATEEDFLEAAVVLNEDSEDESVADDAKSARKIAKRNRKRLRTEWAPLHEAKKYKDWANWWKDYKNVGEEINQQLLECGNLNLEHCFLPNLPKLSTEQVVYAIIKSAHFGLEKNADVPYDTMKTIFTLMNRTFLDNLTELNMVEIQDIIRGIPNDLWVYKMRSMVYLWAKYKAITNSKSTAEEDVKDQQAIAREWKSPCFHWLSKQAFDELVAISETEWKDHRSIFPVLE
ncbi:protein lingerer [Drosophila elegans]|uniref:protein lingerer n=1 Tax=Drosophila elegans TaxID=30023 RepID=UPI0007E82BAC|nr:protein lingerer [Drosophila elegans]